MSTWRSATRASTNSCVRVSTAAGPTRAGARSGACTTANWEGTVARLPLATRESVPEGQQAYFDEIVQGVGSVPRYGPGSVMVHVPQAHRWVNGLNRYLRTESSLPKKIQELAMLVTARERDCQYIWNAHAASARQAGVNGTLVD